MTKEQILDRNGFDFDAFKYENEYSAKAILTAMDELVSQEVAKERERAGKLVEALKIADAIITENVHLLPHRSFSIRTIKQTINEYNELR